MRLEIHRQIPCVRFHAWHINGNLIRCVNKTHKQEKLCVVFLLSHLLHLNFSLFFALSYYMAETFLEVVVKKVFFFSLFWMTATQGILFIYLFFCNPSACGSSSSTDFSNWTVELELDKASQAIRFLFTQSAVSFSRTAVLTLVMTALKW